LGFDPEREEADLRAYLGEAYDRKTLERNEQVLDQEATAVGDEREFYRTSRAYLYNLTVFAMSGTKLPYLDILTSQLPRGARLLDYGCGIGSDGLMLLEAGYQVEFADFHNPSTDYLRWRLERRSLDAKIHDVEGDVPGGFDAAYAFDVIEHVADPYAFLREMEQRARLVEVNLLEFDPNEQELHYELPIGDLLRYTAGRRLELYRILHGTSHLVLYGPQPVGRLQRARNLARIAAERIRRRHPAESHGPPGERAGHPNGR
jgi:2-polyprenyl-3-methyl-5-hydroxy-6-metoxy-1,4-benzoquinol methylase